MSNDISTDTAQGLALGRYQVLMAHFRGDQEIFWRRFGFVLLAEVVAFGFFFNLFVETVKDPALAKSLAAVLALLGLCLVGVLIELLFDRLYFIMMWWNEHWLTALKSLEPSAFGDLDVFRNTTAPGSARQGSRHIMVLLGAVWVVFGLIVLARAIF